MRRHPGRWTLIDIILLLIIAIIGAAIIVNLAGENDTLEREVQGLRSELQLRATLVPPPGTTWTQADTLVCYPQRFDR